MKVEFHYFVTKYLAKTIDFPEELCQLLAEYAQFVGENNRAFELEILRTDLPEEISNRPRLYEDSSMPGNVTVKLLKTAPANASDLAAWRADLLDIEVQKYRLIPFHYLPAETFDFEEADYMTLPISNYSDNEVFNKLFIDLRKQIKKDGDKLTKDTAMKLGVLLHILEDSFSYKYFNGKEDEDDYLYSNQSVLKEFKKCDTEDNLLTEEMNAENAANPKVGHAQVGQSINMPNAKGVFYQANMGLLTRTRQFDNGKTFISAAEAVYKLLLQSIGLVYDNNRYQFFHNSYAPVIKEMLKLDGKTVSELCNLWKDKTGYEYSYDADKIFNRIKSAVSNADAKHEFYELICFENDIIDSIYPDDVMALTGSIFGNSVKPVKIGELDFDNDEYIFDIEVSETGGNLSVAYKILTIPDGDVVTSEVRDIQEGTPTKIHIPLKTLLEKEGYRVKVDLNRVGAVIGSDYIDILHEYDASPFIVTFTDERLAPDKDVVVANHSKDGDFNYPDNAVYTDQFAGETLDIFLEVELEIYAKDNYKIIKFEGPNPQLKLIKSKGVEKFHCKNDCFNLVSFDKNTRKISLKYNAEWKNRLSVKDFSSNACKMRLGLEFAALVDYNGGKKRKICVYHCNSANNKDLEKYFPKIIIKKL